MTKLLNVQISIIIRSSVMDQGLAALLGALIGGGIAPLTSWWIESRKEGRVARNAVVAAASELDAVLIMLNARRWREGVAAALQLAESGTVFRIEIFVKDDYLPLCRVALKHAGSIDNDLAVLLARAIILQDGLISDIQRLSKYDIDAPGSLLRSDDPEQAVTIYQDLLQIIDSGFEVGSQIIALAKLMYPPHKQYREKMYEPEAVAPSPKPRPRPRPTI